MDYSFDSIKVIEEELGRISNEVDGANPRQGTSGLAMGYGAYIGEVFRRRDGQWITLLPADGRIRSPRKAMSLCFRSAEGI